MNMKKIFTFLVWAFAAGFVVLHVLHFVWYRKEFLKSLWTKGS